MSDINAKRANIENSAMALTANPTKNRRLLASAEGDDRKKLQRGLKGQLSSYFNLGQKSAGSGDSMDRFKKANNGLGEELILAIAKIRNLPLSKVRKMFSDIIDQRKKSEAAR